jgi:hypothetical protein
LNCSTLKRSGIFAAVPGTNSDLFWKYSFAKTSTLTGASRSSTSGNVPSSPLTVAAAPTERGSFCAITMSVFRSRIPITLRRAFACDNRTAADLAGDLGLSATT